MMFFLVASLALAQNDVTKFGVRAVTINDPPAQPGLTATIAVGSNVATLTASPWNGRLQNGDNILVDGAGQPNGMATPPAPTLQSSIAAALPGTGYVVPSIVPATVKYCYDLFARDANGGYTPGSAQACVMGPASLGPQLATLSGCTSVANVKTCTTSKPHGLAPGATVVVKGTSDDPDFGGLQHVTAVTDATHFSYANGMNVSASATGGNAFYWNCIHVTFQQTVATNVWEYVVQGRTAGNIKTIGVSKPLDAMFAGDTSFWTFDDFGSPSMDYVKLPPWLPTTVPTTAHNDHLSAQIVSGGGSTTLTLSLRAASAVSNAMLLYDDGPKIAKAYAAQQMVFYPPAPIVPGVSNGYVINSVQTFSGATSQAGPIYLGDTLVFNGIWRGDLVLNGAQNACPQFCIEPHVPIYTGSANPGMLSFGGSVRGVAFVPSGNAYNAFMLYSESMPALQLVDDTFGSATSYDYTGVPLTLLGVFRRGSAGVRITNMTLVTGPDQVDGLSLTPAMIVKNVGEVKIDCMMQNRRGLFFKPDDAGLMLDFDQCYEIQGPITPVVSLFTDNPEPYANVKLRNVVMDTGGYPLVSNLGGVQAFLSIDGSNSTGIGMPLVSGAPFWGIDVVNWTGLKRQLGQNGPTVTGKFHH